MASLPMLSEFSCDFCLVGHSERRNYHQETDEQVAAKVSLLREARITPVLCVGETLDQRDQNQPFFGFLF